MYIRLNRTDRHNYDNEWDERQRPDRGEGVRRVVPAAVRLMHRVS